MNIETKIKLNQWIPRDYQRPMCKAFLEDGYKRLLISWPRRAGKDVTAFNLCILACLKKVQTAFYIFPTFSSGRRILWDAVMNDGRRILDFIPPEIIESRNEQQMRIRFRNGSQICIIGSDSYDTTLVGVNAGLMVFSEYALSDPRAYQFARPILTANNGTAIFVSTPRGKNHFWELYQIAINNPKEWFVSKLTVEDTNHIPLNAIEKEIASGEMSEDLARQEYWTDFTLGVEGSYYSKYLDRMRLNNQIGDVPWEPAFKVHLALDIGVRDSTNIIFYQVIGQTIKIIDSYCNSKVGLEHYAKIIQEKPYIYGKMVAPHDIAVQEFGSGITRIEKARQLGINFTICRKVSIEDGIEKVRSTLPKIYISNKCGDLIKSIENYRQEYDSKRKVYSARPLHDIHSHWADALRYMCVSLSQVQDGSSPDDLERRYREAMYGEQSNMPSVFRTDLPDHR